MGHEEATTRIAAGLVGAARERHAALRRSSAWRIGAIVAVGAVTAALGAVFPLFDRHPIALFYAYALFATWYGVDWEGGLALVISAAAFIFVLPRFAALSLEALIFLVASLIQLGLVNTMRRTRAEARRDRALAETAVRVRDDFLTAAAHDLRTPLTVIAGRIGLIESRLESDRPVDAAYVRPHVMSLREAASRMLSTVEEVTDMAHLQMGQQLALHRERIDIAELVRAIARTIVEATVRQGAASVVVEAPGEPLFIEGDRPRLERVMQNIIGNAVKYSREQTPVRVRVEVGRSDGGGVTVTVRDHGVGIPADELPHIFEHFYRASTARGIGGTGIGLAGSRMLVEQHGGRISVESLVGEGTTVVVSLPPTPRIDTMAGVPSLPPRDTTQSGNVRPVGEATTGVPTVLHRLRAMLERRP